MLCDAMKWNHLPERGGLYDQNPDLLDHFYYIFVEKSKEEAKQRAKSEKGNRSMRSAGRR